MRCLNVVIIIFVQEEMLGTPCCTNSLPHVSRVALLTAKSSGCSKLTDIISNDAGDTTEIRTGDDVPSSSSEAFEPPGPGLYRTGPTATLEAGALPVDAS